MLKLQAAEWDAAAGCDMWKHLHLEKSGKIWRKQNRTPI